MANKKLTDFTTQAVLNTSTRLYGVPYSGLNAFVDTQVPITVLFDNTALTGTTTAGTISATTITAGGVPVVTTTGSQTLTNKTLTAPVISTITNTGTLTLPTSTDTLVGRATTDTLTNKTLTSPTINAGALSGTFSGGHTYSGAVAFTSTITPSQTAGIVGTTTNNNANAGSVGEFVSQQVTGGAITSGVITNLTSISLTAGDWEVDGFADYLPGVGCTAAQSIVCTNSTSAALQAVGRTVFPGVAIAGAGGEVTLVAPTLRYSLTATTTIFLVGFIVYSGGTLTYTGAIRARRVR